MTAPLHRKIVEASRLAAELKPLRAAGRTVVQCHGCFDIVHPGHIRYLHHARQLGDILIVSLTGDAQITKGADRPYIAQGLRAENLAALEFVDWVVIDPNPTAAELLETLQPDVYIKGREYAASNDPRFLNERAIVERHGGRVVFHSGEVVFSSTRLIENLRRDAALDECRVRDFCRRAEIDAAGLRRLLTSFAGLPAIVVGDVVRERYIHCDTAEAAPDAPVMSLRRLREEKFWSGAAGIAAQLAALGADTLLVTATGGEPAALRLGADGAVNRFRTHLLPIRPNTPERSTFLADESKVFRVHAGDDCPLDSARERQIESALLEQLPRCRLLIWHDAGFGMVAPNLVRTVNAAAQRAGVIVVGHAGGERGRVSNVERADLLVATERHARELMHDRIGGLSSVVWNLLAAARCQSGLILLHKRGVIAFDGRRHEGAAPVGDGALQRLRSEYVPSAAEHYVDLLGADIAVAAMAGLARVAGGSDAMLAYLASAIEAASVARRGPAVVELADLFRWLSTRPELYADSRFLAEETLDAAHHAPPATTSRA